MKKKLAAGFTAIAIGAATLFTLNKDGEAVKAACADIENGESIVATNPEGKGGRGGASKYGVDPTKLNCG